MILDKVTTWHDVLKAEFAKEYFQKLELFLEKEKQEHIIYPSAQDVFNAFDYCSFAKIKIVILGQDPYHGPNQAHGLAFSVQKNISPPPSLKNIFKELKEDIEGFEIPTHGDLSLWAQQGVFLLNTCLTVRADSPGSHFNQGWEIFTDRVIELINEHKENIVFMLWGSPARKKKNKIDTKKHLILEAPHPSPLSAYRGFFGAKHFSQANKFLEAHNQRTIIW